MKYCYILRLKCVNSIIKRFKKPRHFFFINFQVFPESLLLFGY